MLFKDIIGQDLVKKNLINVINNNRLGHTLLFSGKSGVGKLALAIALTQYIACKNKQNDDACNRCNACIKYNKLIHPDLHFSFPIIKRSSTSSDSKLSTSDEFLKEWREFILNNPYDQVSNWYKLIGTENKQGYFYAEESNRIIKILSLKTYESDYKNLIIWLPEKMDARTGNKLLKIIEEPYDKTFIIMVSEEPESILPTIRSRAQKFFIPLVDAQSMKPALKNKYPSLNDNKINEIYHNSEGSVTEAIKLIEESVEEQFEFNWYKEMMRNFHGRNIHKINEWALQTAQMGREKQKSFLVYTLRMLRENFIFSYANGQLNFSNDIEKDMTHKTAFLFNDKNIEKLYDECSRAYNNILRNANPKILFFDFSLKMIKLLKQ